MREINPYRKGWSRGWRKSEKKGGGRLDYGDGNDANERKGRRRANALLSDLQCELSSLVNICEGRELLRNELVYRSQGGGGDRRRSYRSELVADVTTAIQKARRKQFKSIIQVNKKSQPKRTLELTPDKTSDEQAQQDVLHKRQRRGRESSIAMVVKNANGLPSRSMHRLQAEEPGGKSGRCVG